MPQFDLSCFSSQLFWLVLSFVPLYLALQLQIVPRLHAVLSRRWEMIEGTLHQAKSLNEESALLTMQANEILTGARQQAHELLVQATKEVKVVYEAKFQKVEKTLHRRYSASEVEFSKEIDLITQETPHIASQLIEHLLNKLSPLDLPAGVVRQAVEHVYFRKQ